VHVVNVVGCQPDEDLDRGVFGFAALELTERLGANVIGATVYGMDVGQTCWPYHYHHGVEEWLYVVSGMPVLRDPSGERALEPGDLVAFPSGPDGSHTVCGPGRVVIFSAGARGFGEAFVTVYPDSDKIGAAPGMRFRRADAIDAWRDDPGGTSTATRGRSALAPSGRTINLASAALGPRRDHGPRDGSDAPSAELGPLLGAQTWTATLHELAPGQATSAYHYEWCREKWALVVSGSPNLGHADGQTTLSTGDICCFPQGPTGAHRLSNDSRDSARLIIFSTPTGRPMSAFYPEQNTVVVSISDDEGFLFRYDDRIEDYWDGEPGAG
jgi:uncharacterized cupin superfamily protein